MAEIRVAIWHLKRQNLPKLAFFGTFCHKLNGLAFWQFLSLFQILKKKVCFMPIFRDLATLAEISQQFPVFDLEVKSGLMTGKRVKIRKVTNR